MEKLNLMSEENREKIKRIICYIIGKNINYSDEDVFNIVIKMISINRFNEGYVLNLITELREEILKIEKEFNI